MLQDLLPFMDGSPKDHVSLSNKRPRESSLPNKIQVISEFNILADEHHSIVDGSICIQYACLAKWFINYCMNL